MRLPMRWLSNWIEEDLEDTFGPTKQQLQDEMTAKSLRFDERTQIAQEAIQIVLKRSYAARRLAKKLTDIGLEVEALDQLQEPLLEQIFERSEPCLVLAKVEQVAQHPEADKLRVATVFDGKNRYNIVCGASNCDEGIYAVLAKEGARLYPLQGKEPLEIKKAVLRGVASEGMLCAYDEVGAYPLIEESRGIIDLGADFPHIEKSFWEEHLGESALEWLAPLLLAPVLELGITPNLAHCFSVKGIARELAANCSLHLKKSAASNEAPRGELPSPKVTIEEGAACRSYRCARIDLGRLAPELPEQRPVKERSTLLEAAGERSLLPIIDLTNFVMLDRGHPVHAFDADKIVGDLVVRRAKEGEKATTLDGAMRCLDPEMTVIADQRAVLAIAGVMGCEAAAVDAGTTNILYEVAQFEPTSVRKTSKKLALSTGSSKRFERGVDRLDDDEVMQLLLTLSRDQFPAIGAEVQQSEVVLAGCKGNFSPVVARVDLGWVEQFLGAKFDHEGVVRGLEALGITLKREQGVYLCTPPSHRFDLICREDYAEEVLKFIGLEALGEGKGCFRSDRHGKDDPCWTVESFVRDRLSSLGLYEVISPDLIDGEVLDRLQIASPSRAARLVNPSNQCMDVCRPSLLPGMVDLAKQARSRAGGSHHCAFFEVGSVYEKELQGEERYKERRVLGLLLSQRGHHDWRRGEESVFDFYDLKGFLAQLFLPFGLITTRAWTQEERRGSSQEILPFASSFAALHPGQSALLQLERPKKAGASAPSVLCSMMIGELGQLHPQRRAEFDLKEPLYFAQIDLEALLELLPSSSHSGQGGLWRGEDFPQMSRDLTLELDQKVFWRDLLVEIERYKREFQQELTEETRQSAQGQDRQELAGPEILRSVDLLSVFPLPEKSRQNVTLRFLYRHAKRTLRQEEVDALHQKMVTALSSSFSPC